MKATLRLYSNNDKASAASQSLPIEDEVNEPSEDEWEPEEEDHTNDAEAEWDEDKFASCFEQLSLGSVMLRDLLSDTPLEEEQVQGVRGRKAATTSSKKVAKRVLTEADWEM